MSLAFSAINEALLEPYDFCPYWSNGHNSVTKSEFVFFNLHFYAPIPKNKLYSGASLLVPLSVPTVNTPSANTQSHELYSQVNSFAPKFNFY